MIFGSVADNLCNEKSDLDILVIPLSNEKYWDFRHELEEALGLQIDLYTKNDDPVLVKKIFSRGEIVYEV
ncbi:MAG: nucleotidyltransferase domain-containing protein [Desulfobacterales bacterium]|uniref:Nucleotidyltransferase domain-containing protein n=1 Tax=Candidatus Desulfatibia profunda TaxID=2841695 RepID=A0A8J6NZL9_9BACT|nr:nucleotidyltransferase domain-containing protein [Candidatus Desulfatibia profunda]MBL7180960.1 nucleotidyltransferase domain-containing protein [Desulfobacterales bacterium]MBU0699662.1 nucleotidyltransferase domain-containing protein [Pseudomonadota bacterium]